MKPNAPSTSIPASAKRRGTGLERPPALLPEAYQELQAAMQELEVAEEELRSQNEALAHAHALIEAERVRYHELFEFAPDGALVTNPLGVIREANRAASHLLARSPRFLSGKPLAVFVAEEDVRAFRQRLLDAVGGQAPQEWEMHLRQREKGSFPASIHVAATHSAVNPGLRWTIRDLSQRRQPAQTDPEALLETVLSAVPVGVALLDPEGRFARVNNEFALWAGCPPEACAGRSAAEILPAESWATVEPLLLRTLAGDTVPPVELPSDADDGPARQRVLSFHPTRSADQVSGVSLIIHDADPR